MNNERLFTLFGTTFVETWNDFSHFLERLSLKNGTTFRTFWNDFHTFGFEKGNDFSTLVLITGTALALLVCYLQRLCKCWGSGVGAWTIVSLMNSFSNVGSPIRFQS